LGRESYEPVDALSTPRGARDTRPPEVRAAMDVSLTDSPARARFAALVALPAIPLADAALAIAQEEYPRLDGARTIATLDELAASVSARLSPQRTTAEVLRQLRVVLFDEGGFRGNQDHYYDPRNSFLNEVVERRLGIPITLSIVYIEVASRVGLPVQGVAFPGHFLVKCAAAGREVFIDPFHGGEVLSAEDCVARMRTRDDFDPRQLDAVGSRAILARLLHNLKRIYVEAGDDVRALWVVDRLLLLSPDDAAERRDRGLVCARLGHTRLAADDLAHYLAASPHAQDGDQVAALLAQLRGRSTLLN
jgi:regulator of sirC expression with transglutaminase-like and TPR domain